MIGFARPRGLRAIVNRWPLGWEGGVRLRVLVFDWDASRAEQVATCILSLTPQLEGTGSSLDVTLTTQVESSREGLCHVLSAGGVDVLVMVLDEREGCPDGVDLVKELVPESTGMQIVYVDVSGTHATSVYQTPHVYLLPWPIATGELRDALHKARRNLQQRLRQPIVVHTSEGERAILPCKIAYVESNRRILRIHVGEDTVSTYGKLSEMANMLPTSFIQSHKSFLVNMAFIEVLGRESMLLTTGDSVPVSQKRRKATREAFLEFVGRTL